jgi:hypothetical protein
MIAFDTSISPSVWETSGEGLSVQLMNTALRAEKSYEELRHKFGCVGDNVMMRAPLVARSRRRSSATRKNRFAGTFVGHKFRTPSLLTEERQAELSLDD